MSRLPTPRYLSTVIEPVDPARLAELRALARAALATPLKWRQHAVGMLQAYLVEDADPEIRVHIWHPDLVRTDLAVDGGRPHDHRFVMRSTVIDGVVGHDELHVTPVADGEAAPWVEYTVRHARAGAAPLVATGRRLRADVVAGTIEAGHTYEFRAGEFHHSTVAGLAVTVVSKFAQRAEPARVLFRAGCEPAFGVSAVDADVVARYVDLAREALGRA